MKRDMDLIRKILLKIEEQYIDTALPNLKIESYDLQTIAYHCSILYDAKMVSYYDGRYAENKIYFFQVGKLTWEGHEFLDKIRNDNTWTKTKTIMKEKGLPFALDVIKQVVNIVVSETTKAAIKGMM